MTDQASLVQQETGINKLEYFSQGIIDMNRNRNSANFFSYVCNGKKSKKELFASTLNGIPISVRCVSFMIVV